MFLFNTLMQGEQIKKLEKLKKNLKKMKKVTIAFSGGLDSTLLLITAHQVLDDNVLAITAISNIFPQKETNEAIIFAEKNNIKIKKIKIDYKQIKNFTKNKKERCYHCKKHLFSEIKKTVEKEKIKYILDGSNADDTDDYRPGLKAIKELNIKSPLKDAGLSKKDIRQISKKIGIKTWDKPASACLASRIPYDNKITDEKLKMIEKSEEFIKKIGVKQIRVRYHNNLARIEVNKKDLQKIIKNSERITKKLKQIGFMYVTLDIQGYRTGSLNEVLNK